MARKIRCWSRKNKQNARYVVCSGSKGQKKLRRSKRLRRKKQKGGEVKAFVGESWSSSPSTWPGVGGKDGVTNHYALAKSVTPLPASSSQSGGALRCWSRKNKSNKRYVVCSGSKGQKRRKSKRLRKKQKGGGLRCWSRKNKSNKRYVVCSGSKGQKRRRSKRLRKKQKGGQKGAPLAPQVLVNAGRSLLYGGESVYNSVRGVGSPQDPNPTIQPAMSKGVTPSINTDRISDIYSSAQKSVGAI